MLASSHHVASSFSLSVSFLIMFLAAASVHWGGPSWFPVLLASPAKFLSGLGGIGLWLVVGLLVWGVVFVWFVVVVMFWFWSLFLGRFGWFW